MASENLTVMVSPFEYPVSCPPFGSSATIPVIKGIVIGVETPVSVNVDGATSVVEDDAAD